MKPALGKEQVVPPAIAVAGAKIGLRARLACDFQPVADHVVW